jgi:hypothetical protein
MALGLDTHPDEPTFQTFLLGDSNGRSSRSRNQETRVLPPFRRSPKSSQITQTGQAQRDDEAYLR